jgi:hypothetical protein
MDKRTGRETRYGKGKGRRGDVRGALVALQTRADGERRTPAANSSSRRAATASADHDDMPPQPTDTKAPSSKAPSSKAPSSKARTNGSVSPGRELRYGPAVTPRRAVPEKLRKKRRHAVSFGQVLLVSSGLVGFAGTMMLLSDNGATHEIAVARVDLASGSLLDADAVTFETMKIDDDVAMRMASTTDLEGQSLVLAHPVEAGAPIPRTALLPADGSDQRSRLSVPIEVERAVGGSLKAGTRVHLIGVLRDGSTTFASFVATDVEVTGVREDGSSGGGLLSGSGSGKYFLTVALNPDDLLAVTTVLGAGTIEIAEAPPGGGMPDISKSAVATEAGVVVVPRETLVSAIESEGRDAPAQQPAGQQPTEQQPTTTVATEGGG